MRVEEVIVNTGLRFASQKTMKGVYGDVLNVLVFEKTYGQISIFITKAKKPALSLLPNKKTD